MNRILVITYDNTLSPAVHMEVQKNIGNYVFINAILSYFYSKTIPATFVTHNNLDIILDRDKNWVNNNFDKVVISEANIFDIEQTSVLDRLIKFASLINKPIYLLGAGAQSTIDYSFDFIYKLADKIKNLYDLIYSRGGVITVRGNFTKEALNRIGLSGIIVTGCPSIYYNGPDFFIGNDKIDIKQFLPIFNGTPSLLSIYQEHYPDRPKAIFYDQDLFYNIIYGNSKTSPLDYMKSYMYLPIDGANLILDNQIRLFLNYKHWSDDIKHLSPSFSYGTKIHGSIISLLNGVPAFLKVIDSRTREMADFYKIPNSYTTKFDFDKDDLYDLYQDIDWTEFNENYKVKYNNFSCFLKNHDLPNVLGNNHEYKLQQEELLFSYPDKESISNVMECFSQYSSQWEYLQRNQYYKVMMRIIRGAIPFIELRHNFRPYLFLHRK